nr:CHAT domain-containing protein [Scytonema sp. UIC 10036]
MRQFLVVLCLISFTCSLWLGVQTSPTIQSQEKSTWFLRIGEVAKAQSNVAERLVQQGLERHQTGDTRGAIESWQKALTIYQKNNNSAHEAIVRENLVRAYQQIGQPEQAINRWNELTAYYRQVGNWQFLGRSLSEQSQAYNSLGQPLKAIALLCNPDKYNNCRDGSALEIARATSDRMGEVAALGSLGDAKRLTGDYELAIKYLENSLEIVKKLKTPALRVSVLNSLGNAYISSAQLKYRRADSATQIGDNPEANKLRNDGKQLDAKALGYLRESSEIARSQKDISGEMRSLVRIIPLYYRHNLTTDATNSLQHATKLLEQLPDSRARVYTTIDLVHLLEPVANQRTSFRTRCLAPNILPKATSLLNQAITVAQRLQDFRAESFALGELGHIYECRQEYPQALEMTGRARSAAEQNLKSQDSLYLWEWQIGRILKAQGKTDGAISAYERAINTLETIRRDILTANRDIQFDFRDTIEPIYHDLVALRLSSEQPVQTANKSLLSKDSKENFRSILKTIDLLKLAELQNFFGNDCVLSLIPQQSIDNTGNSTTAFLNTIILEDKTAVILSLPSGQKKLSWIPVQRQDLINRINEFRRGLERFRDNTYDTSPAEEVYDWLIRPFIEDFKQTGIKTIVFVQDGILRSIAMTALYDRQLKQFLIQQYAIATVPSINLTDTKPLSRKELRVLALGLSQTATVDGTTFAGLKNVIREITEILQKIPGKKLLDDEFTNLRLQEELSQKVYPILHIATHGKFGAEPQDTFIVTGKNQKLTFNELDRQIKSVSRNTQPLELLSLTACETAVGDERATLGLAGVAIQAGAKSALATLWAIDDVTTVQIATDFYSKLSSDRNTTKAQALQAAQIGLIEGKTADGQKYTHPYYWSPFLLIGNWL